MNRLIVFVALVCFSACATSKKVEVKKIEKKVSKAVKDFSYSYGAVIGQSLEMAPFTKAEKNVPQFIIGFDSGFVAKEAVYQLAEETLQKRFMGGLDSTKTEAEQAKMGYTLGLLSSHNLGKELKYTKADFDIPSIEEGMLAFFAGDGLRFSDKQLDSIVKANIEPRQLAAEKEKEEKAKADAAVNIKAGEVFLAENKTKQGIKTTASGLQYELVKAGTGKQPELSSTVKVHYHGTLIDGTVFDSSIDRGEPISFPLTGVIKGWQEGLQLMKEGAVYKLYIPYELAYGTREMGAIAAGSMLIFKVELLEVQ